MKVPVRLMAFAAVAVILAAMLSGCRMTAAGYPTPPEVPILAVTFLAWIIPAVMLLSFRPSVMRGLLGLLLLVLLMLAGCSTTEHLDLGDPQQATKAASCGPLPTCEAFIPYEATPKQLADGLYACVLEYRALYSVCYHMTHPQKGAE